MEKSLTSVLVTGCSGFIGMNLVETLSKQNLDIYGVDLNHPQFPFKAMMKGFYQTDLTSYKSLPLWTKSCDCVIHLAANTNTLYNDDYKMIRNNVDGFLWAVSAAKHFKAPLIYASSSAIYGNSGVPMNAYAYSKLMTEQAAAALSKVYLKRMVGLRFFNVYGKLEEHKEKMASMITQWGAQLRTGKTPKVFNDSSATMRDFVHVSDVVNAIMIAATDESCSGIHDVGSGTQHSFTEVFEGVRSFLNVKTEPEVIQNPCKDTYQTNTKANLNWQWKPKVSLAQGIALTLS
jgi:ADP-L-glycero-D-manno-heptose 6-epimerase